MNLLRSTLHVVLMIACAMSSATVRGQNASTDSAVAKPSCCHNVCPCAGKARTPATPMPAAPTSEARTNVDPSPSIAVEPHLVVRCDVASEVLPSKAFQRARDASRRTALPLHVQVCVFLI